MNPSDLKEKWYRWAEKQFGGPKARVETATQAALAAISRRASQDEAVMAARQAAVAWHPSDGADPSPKVDAILESSSKEPVAPSVSQNASIVAAPEAEKVAEPVWRRVLRTISLDQGSSNNGDQEPRNAVIRGRVVALQQRQEPTFSTPAFVWDFRLQRTRPEEISLPLVPVEMRSYWGFIGTLLVGDEIEVSAESHTEGGTIYPHEIKNLSSNSFVRVRVR